MNIAIEAFALSLDKVTGVGNVVLNYINELQALDGKNRYYIYTIDNLGHVRLDNPLWRHIPYDSFPKRASRKVRDIRNSILEELSGGPKFVAMSKAVVLRIVKIILEALSLIYFPIWLARSFHANHIDAYFGIFADFFPLFFPRNVRKLWLIHDLVWLIYPHTLQKRFLFNSLRIWIGMRRADILLPVSENTKRDILRLLRIRTKAVVLHNAADRKLFFKSTNSEMRRVRKKYSIEKKFILSVCTLEPRKNLDALLESYGEMPHRDRYQLVLTGMSGWKNTGLFDRLAHHPGRNNIVITGYIPDKDLAPLYSGAELFVFPSLYEGFGLPVLEAMQCGCPVVASNSSSIPEVTGDAAVLVEPKDIAGLTKAIETVLSNGRLRRAMVKKGLARAALFSWERSARRLLDLFEKVGKNMDFS